MAFYDWLSDSNYNYDYEVPTSGSFDTSSGSGFDTSDWGNYDYSYDEPVSYDFGTPFDTASFGSYSPNFDLSSLIASPESLGVRGTDTVSLELSNPSYNYSYQPSSNSSWLDSLNSSLQSIGKFMQSPGGSLLGQLGGAAVGALGAMQQNKLQKEAQKKYDRMLAERKAAAEKYSAPLRLSFNRETAAPVTRRGESEFFSNNKLPSYYAEGGRASQDQPSVLGFIKYLMAGKKLPSEVGEAKEAERQRLLNTEEPSAEAGLTKALNRREMIERETEGYCGGGSPRYVKGGTSGQSDQIEARLSDGEYVMDADVVSALGDGNNDAGAKALDQMRERVRQHKRSAPSSKIPPKAKSPLTYLKGKKEKK